MCSGSDFAAVTKMQTRLAHSVSSSSSSVDGGRELLPWRATAYRHTPSYNKIEMNVINHETSSPKDVVGSPSHGVFKSRLGVSLKDALEWMGWMQGSLGGIL